MIEQHLFTE